MRASFAALGSKSTGKRAVRFLAPRWESDIGAAASMGRVQAVQ